MTISAETLYNLLPAVYRMRDSGEQQPLRSLLALLADQLQLVEQDIDHLYENWFIETCDEWLVPYLGELLGVHPFHAVTGESYSLRAYVANTLRYRRRKGTVSALEQLAHDVTGWPAKAVEFFQLLAASQHMNHHRPGRGGSAKLCGEGARDGLELLGTPFGRAAHTADVRPISLGRGKYNIPNVGIFLWRQQAYKVTLATAAKVPEHAGCFTFDPFGRDLPLFNPPQTEEAALHLVEEMDVPQKLRRLPLYHEAGGDGRGESRGYLARGVFSILVEGEQTPLAPERLTICDLEEWPPPAAGAASQTLFAVDPLLGRLWYQGAEPPPPFTVSYCYGFSADLGGGPYDRHSSIAEWYRPGAKQTFWQVTVDGHGQSGLPALKTLSEAVAQWNALDGGYFGVIAIADSSSYHAETLAVSVPNGSTLAIVAARWVPAKEQGQPGIMVPDELCPHLQGDIEVDGGGSLVLDGLWIEGFVELRNLAAARMVHCSFVAQGAPAPVILDGAPSLAVTIGHCIVGPVVIKGDISGLRVADSIIDGEGASGSALGGAGLPEILIAQAARCAIIGLGEPAAPVFLERCTLFGKVQVSELSASETIFTGPVSVQRCQQGCIRFSYLPPDEGAFHTPRRFRCQPSQEIEERAELVRQGGGTADLNTLRNEIARWLKAAFVSTSFGDPAYGQLSATAPSQIRYGAEDGAEMGVYCHLKQPQREENLRAALDEYLRSGLEAGIFYIDQRRTKRRRPDER